MKKSFLEIYALAVFFVTVVCFVAALGVAIYDVVQIANPEFTMSSWQYERFQSNDAFWQGCTNRSGYLSDEQKKKQRPSEVQLTKQRKDALALALKNEQRDGAQSLLKATIVLLIDMVVFFVHWILARRARAIAPA